MQINQMNVTGFKSYTEPVQFDFGATVAVIIGNNGVGKSNSLDAICWGMGEENLQAMRLLSPEDIFFAGADPSVRKEEARVELIFGRQGAGDLAISRMMSRDGGQAFEVDGRQLPDLAAYQGAMSELGLWQATKTVIRQEQISDVFNLAPAVLGEYVAGFAPDAAALQQAITDFNTYLELLLPKTTAKLKAPAGGNGGLEIEVTFPDKGVKPGRLLSGGERAVTALALKLALFKQQPSPFYLMDEVEPSLDYVRNRNTKELLQAVCQEAQLIMVTHLRSTIDIAETVHGVRIRSDGSSWLKFHFLMDERMFRLYKCC